MSTYSISLINLVILSHLNCLHISGESNGSKWYFHIGNLNVKVLLGTIAFSTYVKYHIFYKIILLKLFTCLKHQFLIWCSSPEGSLLLLPGSLGCSPTSIHIRCSHSLFKVPFHITLKLIIFFSVGIYILDFYNWIAVFI